jgi:hypothetical protein
MQDDQDHSGYQEKDVSDGLRCSMDCFLGAAGLIACYGMFGHTGLAEHLADYAVILALIAIGLRLLLPKRKQDPYDYPGEN